MECINLEHESEREEMMFRIMFNTAFIRSNILILTRDDIDIMWNAKDRFPKEFRAEVSRSLNLLSFCNSSNLSYVFCRAAELWCFSGPRDDTIVFEIND